MPTVCVIPARGGSKRIPKKNIRMFHGHPIIAYSIATAIRSKLFDQVIVSTDDPEIGGIAWQHGASIWERDPALADDITGTQAVAAEVLRNAGYDYACVIYATSPLLDVKYLQQGWEAVQMPKTHFAFSVGTDPVLHDAGQFYWGKAESFVDDIPLWDKWSRMIPIPSYLDCDINTEEDWLRAEMKYQSLHLPSGKPLKL